MTGCSGKLRVKATAMCIIIKITYTRCLLNTKREAESNGIKFIFNIEEIFQMQYVSIYLVVYLLKSYSCVMHS